MKKIMFVMFLALITSMLLLACGNTNTQMDTTSGTQGADSMHFTDYKLFTLEGIEEYNSFLETMPEEEFITYDVLKEIGEFEYFVVLSQQIAGDYSRCLYSLIDDAGNKINVYVNRMSEGDYIPEITVSKVADPTDLRRIDSDKVEHYKANGMIYRYIEGELSAIIWYAGEYEFILNSEPWFSEFPVGEDTFVSKLLSQETAVAAVESIKSKVEMK